MEEIRYPFIHKDILDYLDKAYSTQSLLAMTKGKNGDEALGFIKGSQEVIEQLRALMTRQEITGRR